MSQPLLNDDTFNEALQHLIRDTFLDADNLEAAGAGLCETARSALDTSPVHSERVRHHLAGWRKAVDLLHGARIVADKPLVTQADLLDSRPSIVDAVNAQLAQRRELSLTPSPEDLLSAVETMAYRRFEAGFVQRRLARMARNEAVAASAVYYASGIEAAVVTAAGLDSGSWPGRIYTDTV